MQGRGRAIDYHGMLRTTIGSHGSLELRHYRSLSEEIRMQYFYYSIDVGLGYFLSAIGNHGFRSSESCFCGLRKA